MGKAVGVDREALEIYDLLLHRPLKRGTCLARVEQNRLIINDRPLVGNMGVGSHSASAPSRFNPCVPDMTRRIKAHHIGRGRDTFTPERRQWLRRHCRSNHIACGAQMAIFFNRPHRQLDPVFTDTVEHSRHFGGGLLSAKRQKSRIDDLKFSCVGCMATEQHR